MLFFCTLNKYLLYLFSLILFAIYCKNTYTINEVSFMITAEEKENLKDFFNACDEMIDGRFILSDVKIARILKSIAKSELLYDMFAKCLVHFNFNSEFQTALSANKVNGGYFVLPTDERRIVALVFCFLLEVDKGKINLQSFVNENFFSPDGYNISYSNFSINVLVPFKNSVMNLLGVDADGHELPKEDGEQVEELEEQLTLEQSSDQKILYANLLRSINELYGATDSSTKLKKDLKEEILIVIRALEDAIEIENLRIINALCIPLEYMTAKNKYLRPYYENFKNHLVEFYYK